MLQRIQTVYLLIIVALTVATLFLPLAVLQQGDALFSFDASGLSTMIGEPELLYPAWGLFALTAIIAIIALVTIFLYKKRILQIRLCVFNALLILGFYGFFAFLIYSLIKEAARPPESRNRSSSPRQSRPLPPHESAPAPVFRLHRI